MATTYLVIFVISLVFILLITLLGELFEPVLDLVWSAFLLKKIAILNPVSFFAALTVFGAVGYVLTRFSAVLSIIIFIISVLLAVLTVVLLYFLIVKPRELSETSLSYSMKQLIGLQATVSIPIPANGFGEVLIKLGGGNSNQIAASYDSVDIGLDEKVFVVDEKEGVVYVSILTI